MGIFIDLGGFAASGGFTAHMYCHKKEKEKKEKSEQGRRSYFTLKGTRNDDVTRRNKRAPSRNKQQGRENKGWERTGRGRGRGGGGKEGEKKEKTVEIDKEKKRKDPIRERQWSTEERWAGEMGRNRREEQGEEQQKETEGDRRRRAK